MARVGVVLTVVLVLFSVFGYVSADECDFNGTVHLEKGDLANYTSDQVGCGLKRVSSSWGIIIIVFFVLVILLMIYGLLFRRK